jgi:hypothetical protein
VGYFAAFLPKEVLMNVRLVRGSRAFSRLAALGLTAAVALAPVTFAQQPAGPEPARSNVAITLTVGKTGAEAQDRKYRFVGQDGNRAAMLVGWRMPIPTAAKSDDGAAAAASAVVNYVYQNIGVSADLEVRILASGAVALSGTLEVSGTREGKAGEKMPIIGTFSQRLVVNTTPKKKIRVAEGPDPEGGTLHVDLEVEVLD